MASRQEAIHNHSLRKGDKPLSWYFVIWVAPRFVFVHDLIFLIVHKQKPSFIARLLAGLLRKRGKKSGDCVRSATGNLRTPRHESSDVAQESD